MDKNQIVLKDCIAGMQAMPDHSVDICMTSPPYNLGIEYKTYKDDLPRQEYLAWLGQVFAEIHRVLKPDGHFWLNVGYSNVDPWVAMDVAQAARQHFILQNSVMWVKSIFVNGKTSGHFKPVNSDRYIAPTWEHVFHFTKAGKSRLDKLAIGVPYEYYAENLRNPKTAGTKPNLRCRGNTWFIPYETISDRSKHRGDHPATFPVALVESCIKISDIKSGLLLDPFMGSGTSAIAARRCGLDYLGFEIDADYRDFAEDRITAETQSG